MKPGKHREKGAAYSWGESEAPKHRGRFSEVWIVANDVLLDPSCTAWLSEYFAREWRMRGAA